MTSARDARVRSTLSRSGPGRPRDPATDQAILQAALDLFIQSGSEGVNIEQIAARAGVARTTVYRRWSSKEALLAQAIAAARGEAEAEAAAGNNARRDLPDRLVNALAETVTAPEYTTLVARLVGSLPDAPELLATYWNTSLAPRRAWIIPILLRAQADGLIPADADLDILLDLISGAIMYHLLIRPGKRTAEEMRTYLLRVLHALDLDSA
jgi:AcrR family transcriptional regulator